MTVLNPTRPPPALGPGHIGFAGLGAMGLGMATNLIQAGFTVTGYDPFPAALENFVARGGVASVSLRDACRAQSKFFVMVASPQQVDGLVPDLIVSLTQGAVLCLFSTLPAAYVRSLKARLEAEGRPDIRLLDCPVSGGVIGANAGKLTIMLSGDEQAVEEILPVLDAVAAPGRLFRSGPLGSASTIKMLNQHLAGSHVVAAAETLAFAKALSLSSREAYRILTASEGISWIMGDRGISMLSGDFRPKSAVTIFTKDMGIVTAAADEACLSCPIASTAHLAFMERASRGRGRDDDASVVCNYEDMIGSKVQEPAEGITKPSLSSSTAPIATTTTPEVVLIMRKGPLADQLEQTVNASGTPGAEHNVRIARIDDDTPSALGQVPPQALVGMTGTADEQALLRKSMPERPEQQLFDFQIVHSNDHKSLLMLVSIQSKTSRACSILGTHLRPGVAVTPVQGPFGSATSMHCVIRFASIIHAAAAAECYALAGAQGVSAELLYSLVSGAAGSSAQFNHVFPKMIARDFACVSSGPSESLGEAMQDLKTLKAIMRKINFSGRMLDAAHQMFKSVSSVEASLPPRSTAALTEFWRRSTSVTEARI